jgi:hypothetical protein
MFVDMPGVNFVQEFIRNAFLECIKYFSNKIEFEFCYLYNLVQILNLNFKIIVTFASFFLYAMP